MSIQPRIAFGLFDAAIKQDSSLSVPFGSYQISMYYDDLKKDTANTRPIITYEPNYWLLDGSFRTKDNNYHFGLFGSQLSDENGDFAIPPVLTVTFVEAHDTDGFSIQFGVRTGDYCDEITVRYYDGDDVLLSEETYNPTSAIFSVENEVNGFEKITITFVSTNRPYRYLRVTRIDYGYLLEMSGDSILSANIVEECDPISANLKYNTLDITLQSDDDDFNILNPQGYYAALKERQPVFVYENIDGVEIFMGQFFLDEWKNKTENIIEMHCIDYLGLLEKTESDGLVFYDIGYTDFELLVDIIENVYGILLPYELDDDLDDVALVGYIKFNNLRELLQQVAFALGASIECSRSSVLKVMKSKIAKDETAITTLKTDQIGIDRSVELKPLVTGVKITSHTALLEGDTEEIFKETLAAGTYKITFDWLHYDYTVTGATEDDFGETFVVITVASDGEVTITGRPYIDNTTVTEINTSGLSNYFVKNILVVDGATLVNSTNAAEVAQRLYDYHQQRYIQKVKLFAPSIQIGDVVEVETIFGGTIKGVVEKMDIDLTGGFVVDAEIVGVVA